MANPEREQVMAMLDALDVADTPAIKIARAIADDNAHLTRELAYWDELQDYPASLLTRMQSGYYGITLMMLDEYLDEVAHQRDIITAMVG